MSVRFLESWLGTVIFLNYNLHTALLWDQNHFLGKKSLDIADYFANDKEIFCFGTRILEWVIIKTKQEFGMK
jgi:hypothetical protein